MEAYNVIPEWNELIDGFEILGNIYENPELLEEVR